MRTFHLADIYWLEPSEGGREVLPTGTKYSTVSRFELEVEREPEEAWSLVVEFEEPPRYHAQTRVRIRFLSPEAPTDWLRIGSRFELLEGNRVVATGEVTG